MHHGTAGKKLIAAALHDLGGGSKSVDPKTIEDLRRADAPPEIIADYERRAKQQNDFIVHPDNWDAVRLFISCRTQWRRGGFNGAKVGLDYVAVQVVAEARNIKMTEDTFSGLQIMEAETLRLINERN
ncbi:DUF1799 domain-containing protein [Paremcibacter congregatus]|uniref:DUF1799 domain-containing protein n=1 Tax=Paremcibacter congregatus TaxID=2043170 RepID=UPI0030EB1FAC|tara:strand:+ start:508 stop:891 length:384 start_codon:yes stop_codon:yes gene_type:complete